jgi:hypothetical protein
MMMVYIGIVETCHYRGVLCIFMWCLHMVESFLVAGDPWPTPIVAIQASTYEWSQSVLTIRSETSAIAAGSKKKSENSNSKIIQWSVPEEAAGPVWFTGRVPLPCGSYRNWPPFTGLGASIIDGGHRIQVVRQAAGGGRYITCPWWRTWSLTRCCWWVEEDNSCRAKASDLGACRNGRSPVLDRECLASCGSCISFIDGRMHG